MIFVTVGTHPLSFERLLREMDRIAKNIDEKVIAQIGNTKYEPKNMEFFKYTDEKTLLELYEKSRLIVAHAGAGTLLTIFHYKKPLIIVPRLKKYKEHIDDHQLELAEEFRKKKNVIVIYNIETLENAIEKSKEFSSIKVEENDNLILFLKKYLERLKK